MERHDSTMRAARYLLGAGTFAVAMVAMTAGNASAQTSYCFGEAPTVCGHVFTEVGDGDNTYQVEEGTGDVTVVVADSTGQPKASVEPSSSGVCAEEPNPGCGYYEFTYEVSPGDQICILVEGLGPECSPITSPFVDVEVPSGEEPPTEQPLIWGAGTGTPGYWKNHPDAWPVNEITIGEPGAEKTRTYTKQEAIALMAKPVAGDKTYTIFASLVSAMLNVYGDANNATCIAEYIAKAHTWFSAFGPVGSGVKAKSDAWLGGTTNLLAGEPLHTEMDKYNNGLLCAPHRN